MTSTDCIMKILVKMRLYFAIYSQLAAILDICCQNMLLHLFALSMREVQIRVRSEEKGFALQSENIA